jgi:signal transduction histidine kinase
MTPAAVKVLLIEDNPGEARLVREMLCDSGLSGAQFTHGLSLAEGLAWLGREACDVVLVDLNLPDSSGLGTFAKVHAAHPSIPIIVLTGNDDTAMAVEAVRQGAQDYIPKSQLNSKLLATAIRYAIERKRAEEDKARLSSQVQQAQKMQALGQLAGGVAHDINNQLAVIAGYSGLTLLDETLDKELQEQLQGILDATQKAAGLTKQLLAFSRSQPLEPVVVCPNEPIRKVAKVLSSVLGEAIEFNLRLAEDAGCIRIDPSKLEQVILNLALNSRDAMPKGGKFIIETANLPASEAGTGRAPGDRVQVSVSDTGTGIPKDIQDKVFDPFFTTKPKDKGTGLGLAMVYGTVKQQDGEIFLDSEPGKGTTMRLCFNRIRDDAPASAPPKQESRRHHGRGERVLLVEDEAQLRKVMEKTLRRGGYSVASAANADEALKLFGKAGDFALVLTDVIMPGMSGVELAARLRERAPDLPVIFCSGYAGDLITAGGPEAAGAAFFTKPVDPDRLFQKMRELLDMAARSDV